MNIGMLWFDNDSKSGLDMRIERAAHYYQTKYGKKPTLCYVHPSMLIGRTQKAENGEVPEDSSSAETPIKSGDVEVRLTRSVLPNHFWIGINGQGSASQSGS